MSDMRHQHDAVHWHMNEITSRIIAESGVPSDRFHLGKIIMQSLKDEPNLVAQIDGATGESETNASVLKRSIQCAVALRKLGLQQGDVMVVMAPNHLDFAVAFYACLFEGVINSPVDEMLSISELTETFQINKPKIIFCQSDKVRDIQTALLRTSLTAKIITFDEGHAETFTEILKLGNEEKEIQNYRTADINPTEAIAMLIPTSGTTGIYKSVAVTHKSFAIMGPYLWLWTSKIPNVTRSLVLSPPQWLTAILNYVCSPYMKFTRIQSSMPLTQRHIYYLINTYKPDFVVMGAAMMTSLLKDEGRDSCDFTCFKMICIGGSAVYAHIIDEIKMVTPESEVICLYGMSELAGMAFAHGLSSPPHSCGKPKGCFEYRLVSPETGDVINEAYKNGELWLKSPGIFKEYYNNSEATKAVFTEDGWFKTGDLLYRDKSWNFFFVERIKSILKYKNHEISPSELEGVIIQHPGVLNVAVTGISDKEWDLPVACVVRKPGYNVTAQEIKNLIKDNLSEIMQLRGGVVFMDELPLTASTKIHRKKLKEMVVDMQK